jgi:FkbM family methyltransferase
VFNKPYYVFRPTQAVRRLAWALGQARHREWETARLPWGLDIAIFPAEAIGSSIARTGVFELPVSETIWRLLAPGELAIDAGANIGYMTGLMASRVGPNGRVLAFEPHPELFRRLSDNVRRWTEDSTTGDITLYNLALSERSGINHLYTTEEFDENMGTASLRPPADGRGGHAFKVTLSRLDTLLSAGENVGLAKVDVEGNELNVLYGAGDLLAECRLRDIVVEESEPLPTAVSELLESSGYRLFGLEQRIRGTVLSSAYSEAANPHWGAPTYLATNQPDRALALMRSKGWTVLHPRRSQRRRIRRRGPALV